MKNAEPGLTILALNTGSSSLKFGLYRVDASRTEMLLSGEVELIGQKDGQFHTRDAHRRKLVSETAFFASHREAKGHPMAEALTLNDPSIVKEIEVQFAGYDEALRTDDIAALNRYFFDSPTTTRFGNAENLYG